jgi:hypothetical protein
MWSFPLLGFIVPNSNVALFWFWWTSITFFPSIEIGVFLDDLMIHDSRPSMAVLYSDSKDCFLAHAPMQYLHQPAPRKPKWYKPFILEKNHPIYKYRGNLVSFESTIPIKFRIRNPIIISDTLLDSAPLIQIDLVHIILGISVTLPTPDLCKVERGKVFHFLSR